MYHLNLKDHFTVAILGHLRLRLSDSTVLLQTRITCTSHVAAPELWCWIKTRTCLHLGWPLTCWIWNVITSSFYPLKQWSKIPTLSNTKSRQWSYFVFFYISFQDLKQACELFLSAGIQSESCAPKLSTKSKTSWWTTPTFQSSPVVTSSENWQKEGRFKNLKGNDIPQDGSALDTSLWPKQTKWWFLAAASLKLYQFAFVLDSCWRPRCKEAASDCFSLWITLEPVFLTEI